jgi:hypothetical protein
MFRFKNVLIFLIVIHNFTSYKIKALDEIRFHVYASQNYSKIIDVNFNKLKLNQTESLTSSCSHDGKKYRPIKLIVHGFAEKWNMEYRWDWVKDMKNEMLRLQSDNDSSIIEPCVVILDWEELARGGVIANYFKAIENMQKTSKLMIDYFSANPINEKTLHCIGFSLGNML